MSDEPKAEFVDFDPRTKTNLLSLLPAARPKFEEWLKACYVAGIKVKLISGTRTYAEQNELYAQGRSAPGRIVTNARGGYSNHNFGIAADMGIFDEDNNYLEESPLYAQAGKIAEDHGLEYGGNWKSFPDDEHVQIKTGLSIGQLREKVANGEAIV